MIEVGTVFPAYGSYWKVTGPSRKTSWAPNGYGHYPVIKCNANGKEFKTQNGFSESFIQREIEAGRTRIVTENVKARTDNEQVGIAKRRIQFLQAEIKAHQLELEQLLEFVK